MQLTSWINLTDWNQPELWRDRWFDSTTLLQQKKVELPLDWLLHIGGPVRQRVESLVAEWAQKNAKNSTLLVLEMMPTDPIMEFERREWMNEFGERNPGVEVSIARRSDFDASSVEWESELLGTKRLFHPWTDRFRHDAEEYRHEPPWLFWSRFPLWLKTKSDADPSLIRDLDETLAVMRVVLSPQDEMSETLSLDPGELKLNPTFDVLQRDALIGLVRRQEHGNVALQRRNLDELDAVILDEIRERFRVQESLLKASIAQKLPDLRTAAGDVRLSELIRLGFILKNQHLN